jgi:hypothetical protein
MITFWNIYFNHIKIGTKRKKIETKEPKGKKIKKKERSRK